MKGSHSNREATTNEMAYATQVIQDAYPEYEVVWGRHGDYGGGRAPPVITHWPSGSATAGASITPR
jgi:hypothetical protein